MLETSNLQARLYNVQCRVVKSSEFKLKSGRCRFVTQSHYDMLLKTSPLPTTYAQNRQIHQVFVKKTRCAYKTTFFTDDAPTNI